VLNDFTDSSVPGNDAALPLLRFERSSRLLNGSGKLCGRSTSNLKEWTMKLNPTQLKQTLNQMNAQVLPEDHPAVGELSNLFGDHTFFLDESGLKVLEPVETAAANNIQAETGEVVSLADWSDSSLTSLRPHEPESTGVVVVFKESRH
jgi:hypothetical protein